jgi:hypothetical protein
MLGGPSLRVVVLLMLLGSVVGLAAILWRWRSGMRKEIARGDYDLKQSWLPSSVWDPKRHMNKPE